MSDFLEMAEFIRRRERARMAHRRRLLRWTFFGSASLVLVAVQAAERLFF